MSVLVVEDDPVVPDLLTAALAEVRREPPNLVIADVHMLRLDGGQLVRRPQEWNLPVVLLSGDANWARTPGVAFVPKPFDLGHLLTRFELRPTSDEVRAEEITTLRARGYWAAASREA